MCGYHICKLTDLGIIAGSAVFEPIFEDPLLVLFHPGFELIEVSA
jgi:hypothetical protein